MTVQQIRKIKEIIKKLLDLKNNPTEDELFEVNTFLKHYFQREYPEPSYLCINDYFSDSTKRENLENDINSIIATLEGMLASNSKICECNEALNLIEEGELTLTASNEVKQRFIAKVFYSYNDQITFDSHIETIASQSISYVSTMDLTFVNYKCEVEGILNKLRRYADTVLQDKTSTKNKKTPNVVINNSPTITTVANAENNVTVDISQIMEQARQRAEDEGLPDAQIKQIKEKLDEIETIAKSNESKGKRWTKAKEILKWVAEQGIAVAGIVLPLLAPMIGA